MTYAGTQWGKVLGVLGESRLPWIPLRGRPLSCENDGKIHFEMPTKQLLVSRILYAVKVFLKNKGEIVTFPGGRNIPAPIVTWPFQLHRLRPGGVWEPGRRRRS